LYEADASLKDALAASDTVLVPAKHETVIITASTKDVKILILRFNALTPFLKFRI
jgi:hypothetical protein